MYIIAVFNNRNDSMKFKYYLQNYGARCSLISTPKGLGSSCGVSCKFLKKDFNVANFVLKKFGANNFVGFFALDNLHNNNYYKLS